MVLRKKTMTWSTIGLVAGLLGLAGCQPPATADSEQAATAGAALEGESAQASYSMGYIVAENMADQFGGSLDQDAFLAGLTDGLGGLERRVSEVDAQASLASLMQKQAQKQQEAMQVESNDNLGAGGEFLAENGERDGVTTTPSGLQYEILVAGDGPKPATTDTVTTHYHGTFIDGSVFDSSVDRGQPASFPLNGVISGWTEALVLMPTGSKWRLFIPPELAYGSQPRGGIPANSTLIFDVELLSIQGVN
jgi:FKBP-type peptidyl-prolyl cis-trans isomerase FklB